jgi:hypothetical protein
MESMIVISFIAILISTSKNTMSYCCLCLLYNRIGGKGRTGSAWKRVWLGEREWVGGIGGEIAQTMYGYMNK